MIQGVDLQQMMQDLDAERAFDVIDAVLVDELVSGAEIEGGLEKVRTNVLSVYNERSTGSSNDVAGGDTPRDPQPTSWTEQTDDGFVGLEAPLG